jgi:hypothetical protein
MSLYILGSLERPNVAAGRSWRAASMFGNGMQASWPWEISHASLEVVLRLVSSNFVGLDRLGFTPRSSCKCQDRQYVTVHSQPPSRAKCCTRMSGPSCSPSMIRYGHGCIIPEDGKYHKVSGVYYF